MPDLPEHIYEAAHKAHLAWAAEALGEGADNLLMRLADVAVVDAVAPLIRALVAAEVEAVFPTSTAALDAFMARWQMGHGAGVGTVSVSLLADVRRVLGVTPSVATRPADPD